MGRVVTQLQLRGGRRWDYMWVRCDGAGRGDWGVVLLWIGGVGAGAECEWWDRNINIYIVARRLLSPTGELPSSDPKCLATFTPFVIIWASCSLKDLTPNAS